MAKLGYTDIKFMCNECGDSYVKELANRSATGLIVNIAKECEEPCGKCEAISKSWTKIID
jgi:hypothetical protein